MSEGTFFVTYDLSAGLQLTSVDESGFLFDSVFFRFFYRSSGEFSNFARTNRLIIVRPVGTLLEARSFF